MENRLRKPAKQNERAAAPSFAKARNPHDCWSFFVLPRFREYFHDQVALDMRFCQRSLINGRCASEVCK